MDLKKEDGEQPPMLNSSSPVAQPSSRKKKKTKRHPVANSTPSNTSRFTNRISLSSSSVLNDTSSFYSIDERFATVLKQLKPLNKVWESKCAACCDCFTRLSTCIVQCYKNKLPDELKPKDMPLEAVCLIRHGQHHQARKIAQGFAIERGFSEVERALSEMSECGKQIISWSNRLSAICDLWKACETDSLSMHSASLPIFWPAIQCEAQSLASRIDKDLSWRQQILSEMPIQSLSANGAYRLVLIWRHLNQLLQWSAITSLIEYVLPYVELQTAGRQLM